MIDREKLLSDLQGVLKRLETDLLDRSDSSEVPEVGETLRSEYERAKDAERTGQNFEDWRSDAITQNAAAWVLSCVFVRFLEDNLLIDPPKIAGPDERLQRARDEHEIYFRKSPTETDREYLLTAFDDLVKLPGAKDIFGKHNPIREMPTWLSGDAAGELLGFFQKIEADSGILIHDFADPTWDTRFLGDLYQDLSESARKKYALLQTPEFVEEFILDRTLDPALDEFGVDAPAIEQHYLQPATPAGFRMIDPACGSGHFLLGTFPRILDRWQKKEPGGNIRDQVQRALDSIHGVDLNPYAVAISRFRLLLAAMRASGVRRLEDAPTFHIRVVCGDSLLHGPNIVIQTTLGEMPEEEHVYWAEDLALLRQVLRNGQYHAVVANPPYITPKDRGLNHRYRSKYRSCHMKYSLSVPFMERIFRLAVSVTDKTGAGFTGQITSNSFMKREFGKKLIVEFLPQIDLTHVVDTSGACIPGHGTPTVILFGRHRKPISDTIRTVMGIRGEPSTPDDPAHGSVWSDIVAQVNQPGSQSEFVSVGDSPRQLFHKHPWSIGGGGAAELKEQLEDSRGQVLSDVAETAIGLVTLEDDAYAATTEIWLRRGLSASELAGFVEGDRIRDWCMSDPATALFPHDWKSGSAKLSEVGQRLLWPLRTNLANRLWFRKTQVERGLAWFEYGMLSGPVTSTPLSIVYGEVATHNHFVLDRGDKVFKQTAPVIKLPPEATEDAHLTMLGVLNSSTACFWLKQVAMGKHKGDGGEAHADPALQRYYFNATKVGNLPVPNGGPTTLSRELDRLAGHLMRVAPASILAREFQSRDDVTNPLFRGATSLRELCTAAGAKREEILKQMITLQEELDWECYRLYGLVTGQWSINGSDGTTIDGQMATCPPPLALGQRAFEIVLARKMASGGVQTTWFERHGSTPVTELPADWPDDYRKLVERRIKVIEDNLQIALIEQPEYKRRWDTEPWDSQLERALREWMLGRLESYFDIDGRMNDEGKPTAQLAIALTSVARLADVAQRDAHFMEVGELYRDDTAFDVQRLVAELVAAENVPLPPVLRYKPSGLRKRAEWEKTWELQRQEDAIDARTDLPEDDPQYLTEIQASELKRREIGDISVPPKYKSSDFVSTGGARYWRLRGKLDVPKERWVSFPHCEGEDGTLVIAWAGYDHLQLARAVSAHYVDIQERLGGRDDPRLEPLLVCLIELLPWLKQWHNEVDPEFNVPMGDYFEGFIQDEARQMNKTVEEVRNWQPPKRKRGAKGQRSKGAKG